MDFEDKAFSLQFYQYLCNIVGSEEVVKTRRKILHALDNVMESENEGTTYISSGSKAEGLDLQGSDYDVMIVDKEVGVYESIHDVSYSTLGPNFIMDTNDTKPEYTMLRVHQTSERCLPHSDDLIETFKQGSYISSKKFREDLLYDHLNDLIIHGPCVSTKDGTYDCVNSLQWKEWVKPANQWIYRARCAWPGFKLTQSIVQYGILFVPIGCKCSVTEDLEWRMSFSVAEKLLIYSFSHTQLLCYALLKIILNDTIKQKHGDLICSYFLKTTMFWLCEESVSYQWKPESFFGNFMTCMKRLTYSVEYETCLHYFIPENNLFEGRFLLALKKALVATLSTINNSLWNNIFYSATFENFRRAQSNSNFSYLTISSLSCLAESSLVIPRVAVFSSLKKFIIRLIKVQDKYLSRYFLSLFTMILLQLPHYINLNVRNKIFYKNKQMIVRYIKTGVFSSSVQAWALLASFFYKCGRYQECIDVLKYSLSKCTPENILISLNNDIEEHSMFKRLKKIIGFSLTCKHFFIDAVHLYMPFTLLPTELTPLNRTDTCISIPTVVYLNVLYFFCLHHLGDTRGKIIAFRDLELTVRERYFIRTSENQLAMADICLSIAKSMLQY